MRIRKLLVAGIAVACLGACSTVNDGVSDMKYYDGVWELTAAAGGTKVREDTPFSIGLQTAFIADFQELLVSKNAAITQGNLFKKHGEIAILVKSTLASNKPGPPKSDDVADSYNDYRLVYYSDDIYQGQFLNFGTALAYGPGKIAGGSVRLEFVILELDRTSTQTETLLTKIAELSKTPLGLTGPAAQALVTLGTALVTSANDDRQMKFEAMFSLDDGPNPLRFGRYALVRKEDRGHAFNWSLYCVNPIDGKLYDKPAGGTACGPVAGADKVINNEFRGDTYFSITVDPRGANSQEFGYETFGDLTARLKAAKSTTVAQLTEAATKVLMSETGEVNKDRAIADWALLEVATRTYAEAEVVGNGNGGCKLIVDGDHDGVRDGALTELKLRISLFESQLTRARDYLKAAPATPDKAVAADVWSAGDFQRVARGALSFAANPNISIDATLDPAKVGSAGADDGMFRKGGLIIALNERATRDANAAISAGRCRPAPPKPAVAQATT